MGESGKGARSLRRKQGRAVGAKEGSSYCSRHRRYHRADAGCELCVLEDTLLKQKGGGILRLQKCPDCGQVSLVWYQCSNRCECLNLACKLKFAENEL